MGKNIAEDTVPEVSKEARSPIPRRQIEIQLPSGYFRMLLAALFAVMIPWAIIIASCMAIYFSTANNVWLADTKWTDAVVVGSTIWGLSYGSVIQIGTEDGSFVISLMPLGISFLTVLIGAGMSRRLLGKYQETIIYFIINYMLLVSILSLVFTTPNSFIQLLFGAFITALICSLFALRKDSRLQRQALLSDTGGRAPKHENRFQVFSEKAKQKFNTLSLKLRHLDYAYSDDLHKRNLGVDRDEFIYDGPKYSWSIPGWMISGIRLGWRIFTLLMLIALILLGVQMHLYWQDFIQLQDLTGASGGGKLALDIAQLMYLPVFLIWGISWYLGVGFYQGVDFYRSIFADNTGPYPVVPVFALMPHYQPGYWLLLVVVSISILAGIFAYLSFARVDFFYHIATAQVAALSCSAVILFLSWLSFGSIGPKNMQKWGAPPLFMAAILMLEVFLPFVLTFTLIHPKVRMEIKKIPAYFKNNLYFTVTKAAVENPPNLEIDMVDVVVNENKEVVGAASEATNQILDTVGVETIAQVEKLEPAPEKDNSPSLPESTVNPQTALRGRGRLEGQSLSTEEIKEITTNWAASSGGKMISRFRRHSQKITTETLPIQADRDEE